MKLGTYRNQVGVTITVTGLLPSTLDDGTSVIGHVYEGYSDDQKGLFGRRWFLLTEDVFTHCGYELVAEATDSEVAS